jgi:hypothetical protein
MRRALKPVPSSRGEVVGVIDPRLLYDTDAVMAFAGIGEVKLRELKEAGRIECHKGIGGRLWYRGEDLIALIVGQDQAGLAGRKARSA